jgi:hypothetical protein
MVTMVDCQQVKVVGRCHKVFVHVQNLKLQTKYSTLPLNVMDMVFGGEWLIQLGTYATKLLEQFMEFKWQGKNYKLYKLGNLDSKVRITLSMEKELKENLFIHKGNMSERHEDSTLKKIHSEDEL